MDPLTGALDASDKFRRMHGWLLGSPLGNPAGYVTGEMQLQQALTDQARLQALNCISARAEMGLDSSGAQTQLVDPYLPVWYVRAAMVASAVTRASGRDALDYVRVTLSISNSPLALAFTLDPEMSEDDFRTFIRQQYALIVQAAPSYP